MNNLNYGYAPGLALQVSGVNKVCWSVLNGDLLLLLCSWLLDRLNDQLVDSFVRGVYTNKICHATVRNRCNACVLTIECNSKRYKAKRFRNSIRFSLKCFFQNNNYQGSME